MLLIANNANAGENHVTCRDGMEFTYTGESSNYSPQDLCEDHGGLRPLSNSNNNFTKNSSSDTGNKSKSKSNIRDANLAFGMSVWFTPYALKTIYNANGAERQDGSISKTSKSYKRYYSAGITLQLRYAYIDVGVTSYAGNTAFYPLYGANGPGTIEYITTIPDSKIYEESKVVGGSYSSGLSLPFVFKRNKKMSVFAGLAYEHSFYMQFNSDTLATSVGLRSSMGKFFIETVSTDTFKSFDFVPPQVYWGYDPSISFKIGISLM